MLLPEREARTLLLVRAVEETDGEGVLLSPHVRRGRHAPRVRRARRWPPTTAPAAAPRGPVARRDPPENAGSAASARATAPAARRGADRSLLVAAAVGAFSHVLGADRHGERPRLSPRRDPRAGTCAVYAGARRRGGGEPCHPVRRGRRPLLAWTARCLESAPRRRSRAGSAAARRRWPSPTPSPGSTRSGWPPRPRLIAARARAAMHGGGPGAGGRRHRRHLRVRDRGRLPRHVGEHVARRAAVRRYLGRGPGSGVVGVRGAGPDVAPLRGPAGGAARLRGSTSGRRRSACSSSRRAPRSRSPPRPRRPRADAAPVDLDAPYYWHRRAGTRARPSRCGSSTTLRSRTAAAATRLHATLQEEAGARA